MKIIFKSYTVTVTVFKSYTVKLLLLQSLRIKLLLLQSFCRCSKRWESVSLTLCLLFDISLNNFFAKVYAVHEW